jgi:hypothetical protein
MFISEKQRPNNCRLWRQLEIEMPIGQVKITPFFSGFA